MTQWKNKRVFISGGAGVIGNALVHHLLAQGAKLFVGDLKSKPKDWPSEILYRQGDLITLTQAEIESFAPEVYFHLAATFERSEETYNFWEENFHHNISLSHHLITLLKECPSLKKVVFASSYLIYDPAQYLFSKPQAASNPLKETDRMAPRNLCGMAKLQHEQELAFIKKFHPHLQIINARIFRSYGKRSQDVVSRWIRALLKGEPLSVYCPEGRFDFVYADDVAEALMRLAETSFNGIVNIGSGKARSIEELLSILRLHFGSMTVNRHESAIPFEASQANTTLFHQVVQWRDFRPLEKTLPEIIAFERHTL